MRRLQQEEKAMQQYIASKERADQLNDEWRKKTLRARELDTKRWLDI